jgi:Asp-tRNA(Asn)/Glu-tRNA(Gln) amidotransferase A subunit family amidase
MSADTALCDASAVWLRDAIRRRDISARDLVESCIQRIEERNPQLNAIVTPCLDIALEQAIAQDAIKDPANLPPLHGLPVLIKDLTETRGLRTTFGSRAFADHVPDADNPIVARLRDAGAIVLGKTNTPEFGAGANTTNDVFGPTRNPTDPNLTSGGSSGGSAVAVATGMAPFATGSDYGGSLRIPAAFCGVVGYRASTGWVPAPNRKLGHSSLWIEGPIARSVADMALLFDAMRGYIPEDPLSSPVALDAAPAAPVQLSDLRVGFSDDLGASPLDTGISETFQKAKHQLSDLFGHAEEQVLDLSDAEEVFRLLRAEEMLACHTETAKRAPGLIGANVMNNLADSQRVTLQERADAGVRHAQIVRSFQSIFDDIDVLICPTCAVSPFPVEQNHPTEINGRPLVTYYSWYALTFALSLTGNPVISLPFGRDHAGMPFGIQLIMPRNKDLSLISLANALEHELLLSSRN